ncbi:transposase [Dethiothermospora halolimnae]|uniref:transposase n=1 Tax=Dethiothermospora halolimnae TaxID=3114390 RepID=UPI003CCBFEDC
MPRTARKKSIDSIYHIMVKSVGGTTLFRKDEDKDIYLGIIRKYQKIFDFKVYAYCLMDNHGHMMIDANGSDVSKFMHRINQSYAQGYNRRYRRCGHLFADRFRSEIIDDEKYLKVCFGYIHNNSEGIPKWTDKEEKYPYSSFGIYMGLIENKYYIIDMSFMMGIFSQDSRKSQKKCRDFMEEYIHSKKDKKGKRHIEFKDQKSDYRSERHIIARDYTPEDVMKFVCQYTNIDKRQITQRYNREVTESKAILILLLSRYCDISLKDICYLFGNISQSRVSTLCSMGSKLIGKKKEYKSIIDDFLERTTV